MIAGNYNRTPCSPITRWCSAYRAKRITSRSGDYVYDSKIRDGKKRRPENLIPHFEVSRFSRAVLELQDQTSSNRVVLGESLMSNRFEQVRPEIADPAHKIVLDEIITH
jgi:hypothetical protein